MTVDENGVAWASGSGRQLPRKLTEAEISRVDELTLILKTRTELRDRIKVLEAKNEQLGAALRSKVQLSAPDPPAVGVVFAAGISVGILLVALSWWLT